MSPDDRHALHRALWNVWRDAPDWVRQQACELLDGRYRTLCEWMELDWGDALTQGRLISAHLQRHASMPLDADYVLLLLQQTEVQQSMSRSLQGWWACQAYLRRESCALEARQAEPCLEWVTEAVVEGEICWSMGMATLFELLVRIDQPDAAMEVLVDCVSADCSAAIPTDALCSWLEGGDALRLGAGLQSGWLKTGRDIARSAWRARLRASVHREDLIERLDRLEHALVARGIPWQDGAPDPENDAWRLLSMLDQCHALAQRQKLPRQALELLTAQTQLAPVSVFCLWRAFAHQSMQIGNPVEALSALARARLCRSNEDLRQTLARLLEIFCGDLPPEAELAARQIIEQLDQGSCGGAHSPEAQAWWALDSHLTESHWLKSASMAMCARLAAEGALEASSTDRQRDLPNAKRLWMALKEDEVHASEADRNLRAEPLHDWLPWLKKSPDLREHLWIEPRQNGSANNELLIVMSCLESRHGFAHFRALRDGLKDRHLLFINNPEFDWYSGGTFDEINLLIQRQVLPRFHPNRVSCYFGSMGGHGALALARKFGFHAITFNPQVDLDLWAAFRPAERERLWMAADKGASQRITQAWERASLCLMIGSGTADREALSALIPGLASCRHGNFIIKKFSDPFHAGLISRVVEGSLPNFLQSISRRLICLDCIEGSDDYGGADNPLVPIESPDLMWEYVDNCDVLQVEIIIRDGLLFLVPGL